MRTLRMWWRRWLGVFLGRRKESELANELQTHIDMQIDENIRAGMKPEEARRRAHITFGPLEAAKEGYRDQRGLPLFETTLRDLGYAYRSMRSNPGFTIVALLSIAIGVGANTAIFSVVKKVILDQIGYREPDRIFAVRESIAQWGAGPAGMDANPYHARQWALHCPSLEHVAIARTRNFHFTGSDGPEVIFGARVSANMAQAAGVTPIAGRFFTAVEEQPAQQEVVVLSEPLWRNRFNGDARLIGGTITLDGRPRTVIGVLPGWFRLPYSAMTESGRQPQVYVPLVLSQGDLRPIGNHNYVAITRLKPEATPTQAVSEINVVQKRFPKQAGLKIDLSAMLIPVSEAFTGKTRAGLWMLLGAVGAVMLIVCVNLANLLLAKNSARRRESAIRSALGASARRQLRQALTESLVLSSAGGALGIAVAAGALRAIVASAPADLHRISEVQLDGGVLVFALAVSIATGIVFGALPAWQWSRTDPIEALHSGASRSATAGRSSLEARRILIGVEVALSAALLILGGLLGSSFARLIHVDKGFRTEQILAADISAPGRLYPETPQLARLLQRVVARTASLPGVESAAMTNMLPGRGETWIDPISTEGDARPPVEWPMVNNRMVSPAYFRTMNIEMKTGRSFEEGDIGRAVGILSEKAAARLWPEGGNVVGRRFRSGLRNEVITLVGIVADARATVDKEPPLIVYFPYWAMPQNLMSLVVRTTSSDPMSLAPAVQSAIWTEEPQMPIPAIRTMTHVVEASLAERRFHLMLVAAFSGFALLVAALGIYGVVAFTVARRRNEIGIRMALGAQRGQVTRAVVRQGLTPVAAGLAGGVAVALALGRLVQGLLFEVRPTDPLTIATVCSAVLIVAVAACMIPARRAASGDPVAALRTD